MRSRAECGVQRTSGTDEDGPDGDLGHAEAGAEGAA